MKIELLNIDSIDKISSQMVSVGVDAKAIDIMDKKAMSLIFKIYGCKFYHANLLKQEALSIGMDTAIERNTITAKTEYTDCLVFGDIKRLLILSGKLKRQPFKFLRDLGKNLEKYINNLLDQHSIFKYKNKAVDLGNNFLVMGILNVTPDSFSDGGRYNSFDKAVKRCEEMIEEGVNIIDIGGESTRPGSDPVELQEELRRVVPVVEEIKKRFNVDVSVDTYKSAVAKEAIECGADIINDISGLNFDSNMLDVLSENSCGIIAVHIKGTPKNMQKNPVYEHIIPEINEYFETIINKTDAAGIERERLVLDPGIGFGKTFEDNYTILNNIKSFKIWGRPILIGLSRKSFIGYTLNKEKPEDRLFGTIGANVTALIRGANILRVHDVKENSEALKLAKSIIDETKQK